MINAFLCYDDAWVGVGRDLSVQSRRPAFPAIASRIHRAEKAQQSCQFPYHSIHINCHILLCGDVGVGRDRPVQSRRPAFPAIASRIHCPAIAPPCIPCNCAVYSSPCVFIALQSPRKCEVS